MTTDPPTLGSGRLHAFDAIRGAMMLLGIVTHAANPYMTFRYMTGFWYQDAVSSRVADALMLGIHVFRLPLFFVMAGFFTALLAERRGTWGMLQNRLMRVTLVLGIFWTILRPIHRLVVRFARIEQEGGDGLAAVRHLLADGPRWSDSLLHLWFLWYLTLFYVSAVVVLRIGHHLPDLMPRVDRTFRALMASGWRSVVLAGPTAALLWLQGGSLRPVRSFVPDPVVLGTYAVFFLTGWLLWRNRDVVPALPQRAWAQAAAGGLLLVPAVVLQREVFATWDATALLGASVISGLSVWLLIWGIIGVALRHVDRPHSIVRYCTDASYWMYLVHFPLIFVVVGMLSTAQVPAVAKLLAVLISVTAVTLVSYALLVRHTPLGVLLNGRRGGASGRD